MATLTDTNILLRLLQPHHPHCLIAERALDVLRARKEILYLAAQNLVELWAVATRPIDQNGLGLTIEQAAKELDQIKRLWLLLPEIPLFQEWERLVRAHRISGKNTHDARIVAAMHVHGIDSILTFNVNDFARYTDITVIDPATLL
jgi:predicted nucleic acid-binding protein